MNPLLYGVAYYPEYEPYERTEKDLQMMLDAGINVIRMAESTWSTWEKRDGEFDFSILTRTLDLCERMGMKVIIGTPTYAVPAWLVRKDPKVMVVDKSGRRRYGARQIMDIMNPTYREHAERIIRRLCEVTSRYSCVIGYQLDNETKHYGTSGGNVRKLFREYLKDLFGTVENLNQAFGFAYWSNSIADWDDLPDVRGTVNGSYACEFERFQRRLAAEFLLWQRRIVDEYRHEDQFVTHNLDFYWKEDTALSAFGYSRGVQDGTNHYREAEALTVAGADIYHAAQDHLDGSEIAFGGDEIRSLMQKPYLILETEAQGYPNWTPFPGQLFLQAMSHLASGARMVEYWHWHSIHNSVETYWKGVLSHDMEENRIYRECAGIGKAFRELSPHLEGFSKKNRVAILTSNRSLTALNAFPIGEGVTYNDVVTEIHRALYEMNIECDIVDTQAVTDAEALGKAAAQEQPGGQVKGVPESAEGGSLNGGCAAGQRRAGEKTESGYHAAIPKVNEVLLQYDVVITPALYVASDAMVDALRAFVAQGGTLISTFKSFFTDLFVKVRAERQPYHLTDVFGMSYQEFTVPGTTTVDGKPVRGFQELLMPATASVLYHYEHRYWGEYAAVTKNTYGKGEAWYIGGFLDKSVLKKILREATGNTTLWKIAPSCDGGDVREAVWPVIIRGGENAAGEKLSFLLNYSEDEQRVVAPFDLIELLTGTEYRAGDVITLSDWDAKVMKMV